MPMPGVWVHPRCLVMVKDAENCVADDKIMCSTPQKQKAIAVPSLHFCGIISSLQILIGEEIGKYGLYVSPH